MTADTKSANLGDRRTGAKELLGEIERQQAEIERLKEAWSELHAENRENRVTTTYLRMARDFLERVDEIKADAYVAHGVEALLGAELVASTAGGRVYCDVVEMPSFAQRSVTYDLDPPNLSLLDHSLDSYLRDAAGLTTVGWALEQKILHYGPPVTVIPNYRHPEQFERSDEIRRQCGLAPSDRLLLAISTITGGFEPIIEALALLPDHVHLATLGTIMADHRPIIEAAIARLGVRHRVHFFGSVPYAQLAIAASGANIGLIAKDPARGNDQVTLPNRFFDCIAAGLPVVTPDVPDVARIVGERKIGVTAANHDAPSWASAILTALVEEDVMRPNVLAASKELIWDSLADKLHAAYGHASSITFIAFCDLVGNQRTVRMAGTLVKRGVKVTICCPEGASSDRAAAAMPDVQLVITPRTTRPMFGKRPPAPALQSATSTAEQTDAAAPQPASPAGDGAPSLLELPHAMTGHEEAMFERLRKEVMQLRYRAKRYDELKWKADRYDRLFPGYWLKFAMRRIGLSRPSKSGTMNAN